MKHRYHLILTLLLLPVQILCLAQNSQFQFEILDTSNFEPISFSTLSWGQNEGTISDDLGFARLIANLEHSDTIYISCIGFSTAKIPIHELSSSSLNKIYLSRASFELSDITITAHKKRIQNSRKIIKTAISSIEKNYPLDTLVYNGYYREYTKNNSDYINVFESIIDLQDPGFFNEDSFQTSVLFKRANNSFTIDSFLLIPYDNLNKFVPFSTMGVKQNNELLILRTHDPIRNYKANSFDFIGQFQKDFVANHTFSKPKITYLDNTPYYYIDFKDNVGFVYQDEVRIQAEGYIYINAEDYGIKKLSYRVNLDNYIINSKLFEVNVEYKKQADKYYLNYISFNNLFRYKEIQLTNQVIDTISNCFTLYFNRELNSEMASDLKNYQAYQGGEKLLLTNIKAKKNQACLWVSNKQHLSGQTLDLNIAYLDDTHKLNFERDDKKSYYQYREFFVKETKLNDRLHENLLDYNRSVFHNEPFVVLPNIDTSWINTPLINEEVETSMLTAENRKILESAASLYKLNSLKQNEITYIQADREVYAPGDTIWLKAYIQSRENLKPSNKSDLFFLELLNESGEIVDNSKFLVSESASKAQIVLDQNLQDGYYYLLAYSSWMKNFAPEDLYRKKILVKNSQQNNPEFIPVLNKSSFFPGDTVQLSVRCIDNVNREANNVPYSYEIRSGNSVLHQGNELASNSDKTNIVFTIPINETKSLNYRIEGKYQGETLITSQTINVINKVHIDFFPEGGHCINSQAINIAFKALTNTGEPIDIKGRIIDDKGEKIMDVSTLHDGMGKFSLTPIKAQNFYLELTEPSVFSDIFPLPAAEQDGWNLSANYEDSKLIVDVRKTDRHE
ncbi:MAG: hypothetical protein HQ521_19735, partial [Bacteroidetes bacterium]|nr:hypothetical protein [Bacteroidota bacterium]